MAVKYFIPPLPGAVGGMKAADARPLPLVTAEAFRCQGFQVPRCQGERVGGYVYHARDCAFWWTVEGLKHWPFSPLRKRAR